MPGTRRRHATAQRCWDVQSGLTVTVVRVSVCQCVGVSRHADGQCGHIVKNELNLDSYSEIVNTRPLSTLAREDGGKPS